MKSDRFHPFLGRALDAARLSDETFAAHGARARWLPPELEAFEERGAAVESLLAEATR